MVRKRQEDKNFGFIDSNDMEGKPFKERTILHADKLDWHVTGPYMYLAKNHCGAVSVANLALYFASFDREDLLAESPEESFIQVHKLVGNGPIIRLARKARKFYRTKGYNLSYRRLWTRKTIKKAVDSNHISTILLANGIFSWHWALIVGYREEKNGDFYLRIMDNWSPRIDKYYRLGKGSMTWAMTEYYLEED